MTEPAERVPDGLETAESQLLRDVRAGLARTPKRIPSRYFYDQRGSELFEEITRLPEYYLTRAERSLLEEHADGIVGAVQPASLVELGAGSAVKTRILLDAMLRHAASATYVPIDVSEAFLDATSAALTERYDNLDVVPVVADISEPLELPRLLPSPVLYAFLGSTIGNFEEREAIALLRDVRAAMRGGDRFLLGVDLAKDEARLHAAYNDAAGVTAEFNRNILRVINRELDATFDPDAFEHVAFYDSARRRIEMHLMATRPMRVHVPGVGAVTIRDGERIMTEISGKYDETAVRALLAAAGLRLHRWISNGEFALVLAGP